MKEKSMCKYCCPSESDEFEIMYFKESANGFNISIGIFGTSLEACIYYPTFRRIPVEQREPTAAFKKKINYCPMCGRKL